MHRACTRFLLGSEDIDKFYVVEMIATTVHNLLIRNFSLADCNFIKINGFRLWGIWHKICDYFILADNHVKICLIDSYCLIG